MAALPNDGRLTNEVLPAITLKDGSKVQTGTAARLVVSIRDYNELSALGDGSEATEVDTKRRALLDEMQNAIEPLYQVGLLQLFEVEEWIGTNGNPGRAAFGELYKTWLVAKEGQG
eukprot:TRINITY_DN122987_c0_g1_i1.p1 TRINITY_DN122987_c0_g1~~TRINITY_DN122987_c0_g1_i1.p1  ORF type:complete len:128 (+),score=17.45 TRINITY_DN122987_c0_g1_i1:37-384(+)